MADIELLAEQAETDRQDGFLYVRYAGWRDETRKKEGRGDFRFRRPDGGEIAADVLNDHKIQIHARSGTRVRIYGNVRPRVRIARTGRFVDLLSYDGPVSELEREPYTVDVYADYILPAIERFIGRVHRSGRWGDRTGTTLNLQVGADGDDMFEVESSGNVTDGSTQSYYGSTAASARRWGANRFTNVTVPAGATINSADIGLKSRATSLDDINGTFHFEDIDNATAMTAGTGNTDITGRTRTTAGDSWIATSLGTSRVTNDNTSAAAEVLGRAGWVSGNALLSIFVPNTDLVGQNFDTLSYNTDPTAAATLDIDYTAGASGNPWYYYAQQ